MSGVCTIDPDRSEELLARVKEFVIELSNRFQVLQVYLYGSFAKGCVHEGSDIDLVVVAEIPGRMPERIGAVISITDLPIEPLVYTQSQFDSMVRRKNPFLRTILEHAVPLLDQSI